MITLSQTLLLGSERCGTPPGAPSPSLEPSWRALDWSGNRDTALLDAAALCSAARCAGTAAKPISGGPGPAAGETLPLAPRSAATVLRRILTEGWLSPMREWMELCAKSGSIIPPSMLCALLERAKSKEDRDLLAQIAGERGRWLGRLNPEWSWLVNRHVDDTPPAPSLWETGTSADRLEVFLHLRRTEPAMSRTLAERTWADESPDFRESLIAAMQVGLDLADEPLLTRALKDKRKNVRTGAQHLLATLPACAVSARMRDRAEALLVCSRGILGRKLEVNLPAMFGDDWSADAIEQKPPAGVGEKAHWTQQILSLVPISHWIRRFDIDVAKLIDLAAKSSDWAGLLIGSFYRAATLHRDPEACAALVEPILGLTMQPAPGVSAHDAVANLLANCTDAGRWNTIAANPQLFWSALSTLEGRPDAAQSRSLLKHVAASISGGGNPGGSPTAISAARFFPPELRNEAAGLLARDNGLSKPAEAFLQALELRAAMHDAFSKSNRT